MWDNVILYKINNKNYDKLRDYNSIIILKSIINKKWLIQQTYVKVSLESNQFWTCKSNLAWNQEGILKNLQACKSNCGSKVKIIGNQSFNLEKACLRRLVSWITSEKCQWTQVKAYEFSKIRWCRNWKVLILTQKTYFFMIGNLNKNMENGTARQVARSWFCGSIFCCFIW